MKLRISFKHCNIFFLDPIPEPAGDVLSVTRAGGWAQGGGSKVSGPLGPSALPCGAAVTRGYHFAHKTSISLYFFPHFPPMIKQVEVRTAGVIVGPPNYRLNEHLLKRDRQP